MTRPLSQNHSKQCIIHNKRSQTKTHVTLLCFLKTSLFSSMFSLFSRCFPPFFAQTKLLRFLPKGRYGARQEKLKALLPGCHKGPQLHCEAFGSKDCQNGREILVESSFFGVSVCVFVCLFFWFYLLFCYVFFILFFCCVCVCYSCFATNGRLCDLCLFLFLNTSPQAKTMCF